MDDLNDDILMHYGVKGMRWGRRKGRTPSRGTQGKSDDFKKYSKLKKKPSSQLSNKQLQSLANRAELEKKYKSLNPNKIAKAKKVIATVLAAGSTAGSLYALSKSPVVKAGIGLISNSIDKLGQIKIADITDLYDI